MRIWKTLVIFIFGLNTITAFAAPQTAQTQIDDAFAILEQNNYHPASISYVDTQLKLSDHPAAIVARALLIQFETQDTKHIQRLLQTLETRSQHFKKQGPPPLFNIEDYDGSSSSLMTILRDLQGEKQNGHMAETPYSQIMWGKAQPTFSIPCSYFNRHPNIGELTKPIGGTWRQTHGAFAIKCPQASELSSVYAFWETGAPVTHRSSSCGSMFRDIAIGKGLNLRKTLYHPHEWKNMLGKPPQAKDTTLRNSNLFDWALIGRKNYDTFLTLEKQYQKATLELQSYYIDMFKFSPEDAKAIAPTALFSQLNPTRFGASFSRNMAYSLQGQRPLRQNVLEGTLSQDTLPLPSQQGTRLENTKAYLRKQGVLMSGLPEPLMHLAIKDVPTLSALLKKGYNIESRDTLGKTPLMAAAYGDQLPVLEFLIRNGADVNARSSHPDNIFMNNQKSRCTPYHIKTGERTALMYAIAEASEPVITKLIEAGAVLNTVDSKGNTLADYINGTGPVQANPKLSQEFRKSLLNKFTK